MKPHQERVIQEKLELDEKRNKLQAFIDGDVFKTIDGTEQLRLRQQIWVMGLYSQILGERIAAFK